MFLLFFAPLAPLGSRPGTNSPATALTTRLAVVDTVPSAVEDQVGVPAQNATAAARLVILLVRALRLPEAVEVAVVALEAEATVEGSAVRKRLGTCAFLLLSKGVREADVLDGSYTCGGVGHLSRDCVQGSKCYNCSGVVSVQSLL